MHSSFQHSVYFPSAPLYKHKNGAKQHKSEHRCFSSLTTTYRGIVKKKG